MVVGFSAGRCVSVQSEASEVRWHGWLVAHLEVPLE